MRTTTFLVALVVGIVFSANVEAGPVYLWLTVNPVTDADAAGTLDGTSTLSGPGRWHLYALDDVSGSLGIHNFNVTLGGPGTTINAPLFNRSPRTFWEDEFGAGNPAGFALARSGDDGAAPLGGSFHPVTGSQNFPGSGFIISGFGRESSDFATKIPQATSFGAAQTSTSWGDYATDPFTNPNQRWLFLAEGTYSGNAPRITQARVQLITAVNNTAGTATIVDTQECLNCVVGFFGDGGPDVGDLNEGNVFRNATTGLGPLPIFNSPEPAAIVWSLVSFSGATEGNGGLGYLASVNPATGEFNWDAAHDDVSTGPYTAVIRATNTAGFDQATLSFNVVVPEPATLSLFGIAMIGALGLVRRRNG